MTPVQRTVAPVISTSCGGCGACCLVIRPNRLMHDVAKPVSTKLKMRSNFGRLGVAIGGLIALVIVLVGIKALKIVKMARTRQPMPVATVTSAVVKEEDWAPTLSAVGSISAVQGAVVSAELGGVVSQVAFESGSTAKKGDLLVQLDASAEEAQLHSAEADLELARADLERSRGLAARKVISKAEIDAAVSKFQQKQ